MRIPIKIPASLRLVLLGLLVFFLALSPRPHRLSQALAGIRQAEQQAALIKAGGYYAIALEYLPWRSDLMLAAGRQAAQVGDHQSAVGLLQKAAVSQPLLGEDWLILGDAFKELGNSAQAESAWNEALSNGAAALDVARRFYQLHLARGDLAAVTHDLRTLADLQPADAFAQYQAGLYLAAQEPLAALPYLNRLAALDPGLAKKAQSLRDVIQVSGLTDDRAYRLVNAGRQLAALEEWQLASAAFENAVELNLAFGEAWAFLAEARQHLEPMDPQLVRQALDQALKYSPDRALVHLLYALYWQRLGQDETALTSLDQAILLEPANPVFYVEKGSVLSRQGNLAEARLSFQKAVELDPQEVSYRRALVEFLLRHQIELRQSALPVAREAVLLAPQDPAALDLMAETLFLLGDLHTALRFADRALQVDAGFAPALLHRGVLAIYLGDQASARQLFKSAKELGKDSATINQAERLLEYYFP